MPGVERDHRDGDCGLRGESVRRWSDFVLLLSPDEIRPNKLSMPGPSGFLPVCRLCHPTSLPGRIHRTSRVPDFAMVTCPGLRPRRVRQSHSRIDSFDVAFHLVDSVGTHDFMSITGRNPFMLAHCGPSPPCVRFAAAVTGCDATRGTRCLARTSGAGTCLRLTKPSFARRTNNLTIPSPRLPRWTGPSQPAMVMPLTQGVAPQSLTTRLQHCRAAKGVMDDGTTDSRLI